MLPGLAFIEQLWTRMLISGAGLAFADDAIKSASLELQLISSFVYSTLL